MDWLNLLIDLFIDWIHGLVILIHPSVGYIDSSVRPEVQLRSTASSVTPVTVSVQATE